VETSEQLAFMRSHGCDEVQGYLLAPPMPADLALQWFSLHRPDEPVQLPRLLEASEV
jgi:EAL domain-containing protein (putative c-di-GMP-specific phosphodiesterase class I)